MADGGPPAPQPSLQPQLSLWYSLLLPCNHQHLPHSQLPHQYSQAYATIKLVHFKPEFGRKPDEDPITHLFKTNDWMDTHVFLEGVKVPRFCLTLVGEDRLWYESLRPIALDWNGLQTQFWD